MSDAGVLTRSEQRCFGGVQGFYEHHSRACDGPMRFAVYRPPQAIAGARVPVVYYLPGLTCTEETFVIKGGAQRVAAELGLALVSCDTSPRAVRHAGDDADWDFGQGAGFYVDATLAPWAANYRMQRWVAHELPELVEARFGIGPRRGIFGHSMGGHGALTIGLLHPDRFVSVSALAPIVAPMQVPWGIKAFSGYLGADPAAWRAYDACALLEDGHGFANPPHIDVGLADKFLEVQLRPELLEATAAAAGQSVTVHRHAGYDHSYYFVATFVESQLRHHAAILGGR
jgi:S-formylglutathione hydrolase